MKKVINAVNRKAREGLLWFGRGSNGSAGVGIAGYATIGTAVIFETSSGI